MGVVNPVVHNKRPSSFAKLDDCSPETDLHCGCKLPYRIPKEHYENDRVLCSFFATAELLLF